MSQKYLGSDSNHSNRESQELTQELSKLLSYLTLSVGVGKPLCDEGTAVPGRLCLCRGNNGSVFWAGGATCRGPGVHGARGKGCGEYIVIVV